MVRSSRRASASVAIAAIVIASGALLAEGALVQLGLTEAAARKFLFDEIKSPASSRRSEIVVAGNRAFLKLPPSARGPAATALFTWAKAYVNSPTFKTLYTNYRRDVGVPPKQLTVDEEVRKTLDDMLAGVEQAKRMAALMPPADRAGALEQINHGEAIARDPETFKKLKAQMEAARGQSAGNGALAKDAEEALPADPQKLFARRLREFLKATADTNFSARTISLTGGADGTVMTWGSSANGALGRAPWVGDSAPSPTPALVPGVQGIRAIGAGLRHMIALTETGTIISWGDDTYGNLGRDNNKTNVPGVIKSLTGVQSIFTINSVCFAVLASGRIMNWGGGVRPWTRPGGGMNWISRSPILLWLDGLDQP